MSDDIVTRLRDLSIEERPLWRSALVEASDEIERLRAKQPTHETKMNDAQAKYLMQMLYELWRCDACEPYCATWNDGCNNPLHKIHEWSWDEYK